MLTSKFGRDRVGQLHLIELLVTTQADQQGLAETILEAGQQQQHLHELAGLESMGDHQLLDRGLARGGQELTGPRGQQPCGQVHRSGRQGNRPLLIGGIASVGTAQDQVLARFGGDHEFLTGGAANGTAVGFHGNRLQAAAAKNAPVGPVHRRIGLAQRAFVGVEGVGVLHDEFASPHQTETGPDLIAKLGLNLIKIHRQLTVGTQQVRR